jgi:ubiquinone/menaquinone biosynthesis C-methylase UbiE
MENSNTKKIQCDYNRLANTKLYKFNLKLRSWLYKWYYLKSIKQSLSNNTGNEKIFWNFIDIWCGTWEKTKYLNEHVLAEWHTLYALDLSETMTEHAKLQLTWYHNHNIEFIHWDFITSWKILTFTWKNIRWVSINQVFHHYSIQEITTFLQDLYEVIEPWGMVSILDWRNLNKNWNTYMHAVRTHIYNLLVHTYETYKWSKKSIQMLYIQDIVQILENIGYTIDITNTKNFFKPLKYIADYSNTYQIIAYK